MTSSYDRTRESKLLNILERFVCKVNTSKLLKLNEIHKSLPTAWA